MSEADITTTYYKIKSNHYLSNCYRHIINSKIIHFLVIIIEVTLNIFQELDIILRDFSGLYKEEKYKQFNYINSIITEFNKLSNFIKLIIMIIFALIFDFIYIFLQRNNFAISRIHIMIIINILELLYFRVIESIFLSLLFSFRNLYLLISLILLLPHMFLMVNNFMYNHLYYFVPGFIEYPYDEFSSLYDIILFVTKLILGIICSSSNEGLIKFFFCILFLLQIFLSFFLLYKLKNQSYLFMKNTFLNETRLCGFIIQPVIIITALLLGKNEIISILFIILNISFLFIIMGYSYFIYNPFYYARIKMETPLENTIFYLYIMSNKFMVDNLFESKLNEHFIKCGACVLCKKYKNYLSELKKSEELESEENQKLLKEEKNNYNNNFNDEEKRLMDLFNVIYNLKNKYFILIRNMAINYKIKGRDSLIKNADHYYINLSFLMYSKIEKNDLTLLLNEKLILEIINQKNHSILDNDQPQINQLLLCNKFVNLSNKIIAQFRDILNCQQNLKKAEQLIDLSYMLKEMQNKEFKKNLFNQKQENNSVSKNMLSACSIIYEELFNTTISNSQTPLRDNIQQLEDIFNSNLNKNSNTISLSLYVNNKTCKIIRVGKDLCCHLNKNLFDVFPLIFKQYQINLFKTIILNNYYDNDSIENSKDNNAYNFNKNKINKNFKTIKANKGNKGNNAKADNLTKRISSKNQRKCVEIKIIICQDITSKIYYQLLTLKLTPLFSNENNYFILLDGVYNAHKYTVITSIDHEKSKNCGEEIINFVSSPELEKKNTELYSMKFENYNKWLIEKGFVSIKLSSFDLSYKTYVIYLLNQKDTQPRIKVVKKINLKEEDNNEKKENELAQKEKINLIEDNQSVSSQVTSNSYNKGFPGLGNKNKNKDNLQEYNGLNQIKLMIYLIIILVLLIFIFEFIHLFQFDDKIANCNDIFIKFKKFSKFYYQIFPLTLSIVCIDYKEGFCNNILSYYSNIYFKKFPEDYFNITLLLLIHNQRIANKMMEKKGYTNEIHDIIGTKKYNQIFGDDINYLYVTQTFGNEAKFSITSVEKKFYEAILMLCNSFSSITENNNLNDVIYLLNKDDNPLMNLNEGESVKEITNYQKDIYEMILNYKMYSKELDNINNNLKDILYQTANTNKIFIYIYLHINILTIIFVSILIYLYLSFCEKIIIKILNFINMTINTKTNDFQFDKMFAEKLENLDIILKLYKISPIKALQNLIKLYNSYQSYITKKSKNEAMEISKRNNKKHFELQKNELDNIPKNQMIIDKKGIKYLNITNKYYIIFYAIIIITFSLYFFLLIKWNKYFNAETNLYNLIEKNAEIEWVVYQGINTYYLMIFNNFTISEISKKMYPNLYNPKEDISFLKLFYQNLIRAFDIKKEIDELGNLYESDISNFTCENLYKLNSKIIEELNKTSLGPELSNIKNKLIKICENLGVAENNDPKLEFERHIQLIKNGLISIDDFDYKALIKHLMDGNLGKISLLFNNVLIYLLEVYITKPSKSAINGVSQILKNDITIMEISFIIIDIIIIIIILFIIIKIKQFSGQILLIKSVFKIYELQE